MRWLQYILIGVIIAQKKKECFVLLSSREAIACILLCRNAREQNRAESGPFCMQQLHKTLANEGKIDTGNYCLSVNNKG